ncbi:MAG: hypothetical protein JXR96_25230 [Deltaproteobacteria bacterium]|nr:hypothetical protein [Deltaproteobacteria bacterium]
MKAHRFQTGTVIEPFGDDVSDAFIGGRDLGIFVSEALLAAGLEPELGRAESPPQEEALLLPDRLFVTSRTLSAFLDACPDEDGVFQLALERGPAVDYALPLQEVQEQDGAVAHDLFRTRGVALPRGLAWPALQRFLRERARPVRLRPGDEHEPLIQTRPGPPREVLPLPRTDLLAVDVRHWVHILWLNHLMPALMLAAHWRQRPLQARARVGLARCPYERARRLNVIGKNCDIHPTAYVEGSILGEGVRLAAFSSVRDSILGDGVEVGDHTKFLRCVVGERCHTLNDSTFIACSFYPDSTLANLLARNSVLGRKVFLTSGVMLWDEAIESPVTVSDRGVEVETGRWMLGCCAGHGSLLGTRAIFLPGRAVPNRTMIVMRPEEGVFKLPARVEPGAPYVYFAGRLAPLEQVLPDWQPAEIEP